MFRFEDYIGYPYDAADGNLYFKDCILRKPIGDAKAGSRFKYVEFRGENMELVFLDDKYNIIMRRGFTLLDTPMN